MTYAFLLESVWHPPLAFAETAEGEAPSELELQALWFSGALGRDFRSRCGKSVRVVQFGEWNRGAGPDFRQVAVEIDGELRTGDLELDPDPGAWESHGHGANPAFDRVVLHVLAREGGTAAFTRTSEHREVPQVLIPSTRLAEALHRPPREVAIAKPGRCLAPLKQMPAGAVARLLEEAARFRAAAKASRLLLAIDSRSRDEALWQALAETLGYRGNDFAMRLLAQRVPLAVLRAEPATAEAVLFGTAGFLAPDLHEQAPADTREHLRGLWDTWWRLRARYEVAPERASKWRTHGQRPANHPHRRVGALATTAAAWPTFRRLASARPFRVKPLVDFLQGLRHPFWSQRHTLTSARAARPIALMGRSRALELVANHLAPLALHEGRMSERDYLAIRHSGSNDQVRRCALRLFGSEKAAAPWLKRLAHHQALLQVYRDFCLEDFSDCRECPFPEQLSQWR